MVYVDTSVLVALIVREPHSAAVARWYGRARAELVSAAWCVTEFASELASNSAPASSMQRWRKMHGYVSGG